MLDALKFVNRATADKDVFKALTHICVYDGKLQGSNTQIAIEAESSQVTGLNFVVPCEKFVKAVIGCRGEPTLTITEQGTLKVSHGRFRVTLPLMAFDSYPLQTFKSDDAVKIDAPTRFISTLKKVLPFISQDASRPWSLGASITPNYVYATNNVTLVRSPISWAGPTINLPAHVIRELTLIDNPVDEVWASERSISFKFEGGVWLRAQLFTDRWPEMSQMFDKPQVFEEVPDGILQAVESLIPFCPNPKFPVIRFEDGIITTATGVHSAEIGFDWKGQGAYRAEVLQLVLGVARQWTPSNYPSPVFFKGQDIEGMMVGVRR